MTLTLSPRRLGLVRRSSHLATRLSLVLVGAVMLQLAPPVWAADPGLSSRSPLNASTALDGHTLLREMDRAFAELDYDGVFSYFSGNDMSSLRVVHKLVDGVQRERLVHLDGSLREIVRHGPDVSCIVMPGDDLIALEQSIPAGPFARAFVREFDRIAGSYTVEHVGQGRVAGRQARRLEVTPKDRHRFGFRLWLDHQTHLLLRSELVDQTGKRLEIFSFQHLVMGDAVADEALEIEEMDGSMVSHLRLDRDSSNWQPPESTHTTPAQWELGWVPPGFAMADANIRHKASSVQTVNTLMYSDGLAAFSVFIEPMPQGGAASMVSQNGATIAITHHVGAKDSSYLVTLVGEIPEKTAKNIVNAVKHK